MTSGVFGLKKVYKKQVQNVTDNNFANWPESAAYGYFGGGNPGAVNTVTRLDFSSETVTNPGKNLPVSKERLSALSNSN